MLKVGLIKATTDIVGIGNAEMRDPEALDRSIGKSQRQRMCYDTRGDRKLCSLP